MPNEITKLLQNKLVNVFETLASMQRESKDVHNTYFKTDATTQVSGLSSGTDPAAKTAKLDKQQYLNGITFLGELNDFFANAAVTQGDYIDTCEEIIYGNASLATELSVATEAVADRMKQVCINVIQAYKEALDIIDIYYDNEIGDCVSVWDAERIVYGSDLSRNNLSNSVTLLQQFINMMENTAVTQGDYSSTIGKMLEYNTI